MSALGNLVVNIGANTASFQSGLSKAEHQLRSFSEQAERAQIESSRSLNQIASNTSLVTTALKAMAGAFSVQQFAKIADAASSVNDQLKQLSGSAQGAKVIYEQLMQTIGPHIDAIDREIAALSEFKDKPAGMFRVSAAEHVVNTILWPKLKTFLPQYPDIKVDITVDYSMIDIVEQKYDAGVRLGEMVAKDMIAVKIGPDMCMAVVATPGYFENHLPPQIPQDLIKHACINLRLSTHDSIYAWEFEKNGKELRVHVKGPLTFNLTSLRLQAVLAGLGMGYVPESIALPYIASGELVRVLEDWCPPFPGYYLYYPNRRQSSLAFSLLIEALRYTDDDHSP